MNRLTLALLALVLLLALSVTGVKAGESGVGMDEDYPWLDHAFPMDFTFENMIDTHQQSLLYRKNFLQGFIYIHYTGEITEDGIPIARKADCQIESCSVGWVIRGIPFQATLVNKGPRIWEVDPADLPREPGFTHFHWTGSPYKPHGLVLDPPTVYDGYLLKRMAATTFYWLGGSGQGGSGGGGCSCGGDMGGGCSGGGGDMGGGGCTGDDGGCSGGGGDMGGGSSGHGGRLVTEGLDSHINITTEWDGTWDHGGCED
jgi:uncharacterized membrane protein YgcG